MAQNAADQLSKIRLCLKEDTRTIVLAEVRQTFSDITTCGSEGAFLSVALSCYVSIAADR